MDKVTKQSIDLFFGSNFSSKITKLAQQAAITNWKKEEWQLA
jgi:hypothetical protein